MGIFDDLFGKRPHDPAQALIEWLDRQPQVCRRTIAQSCGAQHQYAGRVLGWILNRPDCDRGTALNAFWETLAFGAVEELTAFRADSSTPTPRREVLNLICQRWRAGLYAPAKFGFDVTDNKKYFAKKLRQHRCKTADFDLPDDILESLPGERFSVQMPTSLKQKAALEDLIQDMWVCDRAIEDPAQWLPIRKQRLGY